MLLTTRKIGTRCNKTHSLSHCQSVQLTQSTTNQETHINTEHTRDTSVEINQSTSIVDDFEVSDNHAISTTPTKSQKRKVFRPPITSTPIKRRKTVDCATSPCFKVEMKTCPTSPKDKSDTINVAIDKAVDAPLTKAEKTLVTRLYLFVYHYRDQKYIQK